MLVRPEHNGGYVEMQVRAPRLRCARQQAPEVTPCRCAAVFFIFILCCAITIIGLLMLQ
jgi:hypothetical protein